MARIIAIVGETGTGKSTSIKTLDPKSTYIINVAGKELPFKGSNKLYNRENKNYKELDSATEILKQLQDISKADHIKNVVIEDANYIMGFTMVRKALENGYTKFSVMAKDMSELILQSRKLREDLHIFYFTHPEAVYDGEDIVSYKMKTAGKLIDKEIKLDGLFTTTLYTNVEEAKDGTVKYEFLTQKYRKFPAKSPEGMFKDLRIPNDLALVSRLVDEYYS